MNFSIVTSNLPLYRDRITDHDTIASGNLSVSQISRSGEDGNSLFHTLPLDTYMYMYMYYQFHPPGDRSSLVCTNVIPAALSACRYVISELSPFYYFGIMYALLALLCLSATLSVLTAALELKAKACSGLTTGFCISPPFELKDFLKRYHSSLRFRIKLLFNILYESLTVISQ